MTSQYRWTVAPISDNDYKKIKQMFDNISATLTDSEKTYALLRAQGMTGVDALKTITQATHTPATVTQLTQTADQLDHTPQIIQALGWLTTTGVENHWINPQKYAYTRPDAHSQLAQITQLMIDHANRHGITAGMAQAMVTAIKERDTLIADTTDKTDTMDTIIIDGQDELQ